MSDADKERVALVKALTDELDLYSEDEVETEAGVFLRVTKQVGDQRRWSTRVDEIYRSPSGLFFATPWDRGNTEGQENEYYPADTHEVEAHQVTITEYRRKR